MVLKPVRMVVYVTRLTQCVHVEEVTTVLTVKVSSEDLLLFNHNSMPLIIRTTV